MKLRTKLLLSISLSVLASNTFAANPYNWSKWKNAFNDAKVQRGYNSEQHCYASGCNGKVDDKFIYASSNGDLNWSTSGSKNSKWRSELRFNDSFWKSNKRTMTTRMRVLTGSSSSDGFTVAQLHYEDGSGPPARLEIIDGKKWRVKFRSNEGKNPSYPSNDYSTGVSGWKNIQLKTQNTYINVSVAGQTHSYRLNKWPSSEGYYWKTGIYLQDKGSAKTGMKYLYW